MGLRATRGAGRWRLVAVLAVLAVAVHLVGLYRTSGPPSTGLLGLDKLEHAVGFALPVVLVVVALGLRRVEQGRAPGRRALAVVAAVFVAHAVVSELVQHAFYRQRTGDPFDVLADLVGVALGAVAAGAVLRAVDRRTERTEPDRVGSRAGAP